MSLSNLKLFSIELQSYGVREFVEFLLDSHPDSIKELMLHYDLEGDPYEISSELVEKIENDDIDEFLDLIKDNIDEESLTEYINKYLGT